MNKEIIELIVSDVYIGLDYLCHSLIVITDAQ